MVRLARRDDAALDVQDDEPDGERVGIEPPFTLDLRRVPAEVRRIAAPVEVRVIVDPSAVHEPVARPDIRYVVLSDPSNPSLLARVRWPDVFEAISPARPDWLADPGLFDLPYDSSARTITREQAAAIAAEWGSLLPADDAEAPPAPSLMRRMPANWSNLSRAEKRAWFIEDAPAARASSQPRLARWWRRRPAGGRRALAPTARPQEALTLVLADDGGVVIDLTGMRADAPVRVEDG
jgi:hypothetical protein